MLRTVLKAINPFDCDDNHFKWRVNKRRRFAGCLRQATLKVFNGCDGSKDFRPFERKKPASRGTGKERRSRQWKRRDFRSPIAEAVRKRKRPNLEIAAIYLSGTVVGHHLHDRGPVPRSGPRTNYPGRIDAIDFSNFPLAGTRSRRAIFSRFPVKIEPFRRRSPANSRAVRVQCAAIPFAESVT